MGSNNNGPMIELDGCDDVHLEGNRTESERFLKATKTKGITALDNEAGAPRPPEHEANLPFYKRYLLQIVISVVSGLLVAIIVGFLGLSA